MHHRDGRGTLRWLALFCLAWTACSDESRLASNAQSPITVDATHGILTARQVVSVHGQAAGPRIGNVSLDRSTGTIEIDRNQVPSFVYEVRDWSESHVRMVFMLAIEAHRFSEIFPYCDTAGHLTDVWTASSDKGGYVEHEAGSGSCDFDVARDPMRVDVPALSLAQPTLVPDFSIEGPFIEYDGSEPGWAYLGPDKVALYPYALVDCTHDCGADGWWELHSLFYDEQNRRATVGILYVHTATPSLAVLSYALSLPTLVMPENDREYEVSFSPPPGPTR